MKIIVGATGLLGSSLYRNQKNHLSFTLPRRIAMQWISSSVNGIRNDLLGIITHNTDVKTELFYALGNTNPGVDRQILDELNYQLPKKIIMAASDLPIRMISFGSVHELSDISNPYMDSKRKFANFLAERSSDFSYRHFLLHTLYSDDLPHSHMLLGQMLNSIRLKQELKMTSGLQLRQYHHVEDVVRFVLEKLTDYEINSQECVNGPETIQIRELATRIFREFASLELLKLGEVKDSLSEIFDISCQTSNQVGYNFFRPTFEGISSAFQTWLGNEIS